MSGGGGGEGSLLIEFCHLPVFLFFFVYILFWCFVVMTNRRVGVLSPYCLLATMCVSVLERVAALILSASSLPSWLECRRCS